MGSLSIGDPWGSKLYTVSTGSTTYFTSANEKEIVKGPFPLHIAQNLRVLVSNYTILEENERMWVDGRKSSH